MKSILVIFITNCLCLLLICGCGLFSRPLTLPELPDAHGIQPLVGVAPPVKGKTAAVTPVSNDHQAIAADSEESRAQIAFWTARLQVDIEHEKRLVAEERQHWLDVICRSLMATCIIGMIASGFAFAASFIWPWFERLRYAAIAGVGAAVVLFCIAWYLPTHLIWVGIFIIVCTASGIIMLFHHSHAVGKTAENTKGVLQDALAAAHGVISSIKDQG